MNKLFPAALLALASLCYAQKPLPEAEQKDLQSAMAETTNSPLEIARTLEKHLAKYPDSPQRDELERAIVKSAMEANDKARIIRWGERSLARNIEQPLVLERVAKLLLADGDKESAERALKYGRKFEEILGALEKEGPSSRRNRAMLLEELDRAMSRALLIQAQAVGTLGKVEDAIALATKAHTKHANAESARELGRWLARAGKNMEAVARYAEAFTIPDSKNTDEDRARDRAVMAELYRKEKGSEEGLGDMILAAYDRTVRITTERARLQKQRDPNASLKDPMEFTLTAVDGKNLEMSTLRGKVIVMDFWATWCGPCRVQHPLYDEVKKRFADREDVVFVAINTDEDPTVVKPFLEANKWSKRVYFEDGLGQLLRVSSIPTTVVIGKNGQIFTRMNGFVPERFVDQLTERIKDALASSDAPTQAE